MSEVFSVRHDHALRRLLSNPQAVGRQAKRSPGLGAVRLAIACADTFQVAAICLVLSFFFVRTSAWSAAGLGCAVGILAMVVRRGLRNTTGPHKVATIGDARRSSLAVLIACASVLAIPFLFDQMLPSPAKAAWVVCWALASASVSALLRMGPVHRMAERTLRPRIVVVGPQPQSGLLTSTLSKQDNIRVLAQLSPSSAADMAQLEDMASGGQVDKVVLAGINPAEAERICLALGDTRAQICLGFDTLTYMSLNANAPRSLPIPLLPLLHSPADDWRGVVKRASDIAIVLILLPIIAPALLLTALAIRLESPGPILFRQWRFGLGSQPTQVLKFRTMYHNRGDVTGEARTLARDPRVTRVGRILRRTSIDELPQLLNVLRGDMSLVGPRPHATHMKVEGNYYFEAVEGYRMRHRVKPGITGWAQVTGSRGEVDTIEKARERVEKDLWYVRNWSLMLDFKILLRTALGGFATLGAD